jgi:hypothetical protein
MYKLLISKNFLIFFFSDSLEPLPSITPQGFQFLLMDTGSQVWFFVLQYLETVEVVYQ